MDAKAKVEVGEFSRKGKTRVKRKALDHDFQSNLSVTPFGFFLPKSNQTYLYFTESFVTSDFIVDCLEDFWKNNKSSFPNVKTILLNLDNGGENSSRRTQFMYRLQQFVDKTNISIQLAYYPPYHSKYNPIERVWGILEKHWNGAILNSISTVLNFAKTMTYNAVHPIVKISKKIYKHGITLPKKMMSELEKRFERLPKLEKWFVKISPKNLL
jgi:transposase